MRPSPDIARYEGFGIRMTRRSPGRGRLGPPPLIFRLAPGTGGSRLFHLGRRWLVALAIPIILFILLNVGRGIYTNVLWFDSVGYRSVYATEITTRIWLFLSGSGVALAIIAVNLLIARRLAPSADSPEFEVSQELRGLFSASQSASTRRVLLVVVSVLAVLFPVVLAAQLMIRSKFYYGRWTNYIVMAWQLKKST